MAVNSDPGWTLGYQPTVAQWAAAFDGKVDGENGQADNLLINGGTIAGTIAAEAGVRIEGTLAVDTLLAGGALVVTTSGRAVGDGVTDDTAALNAWLAAGGGPLPVPPGGFYLVSGTLTLSLPGTRMIGVGPASLIKLVLPAGSAAIPVINVLSTAVGSVLDNFAVDANSSTGLMPGALYGADAGAPSGVLIQADQTKATRLWVKNSYNNGIFVVQYTSASGGINAGSPKYVHLANIYTSACSMGSPGGAGIDIGSGWATVSDCTDYASTGGFILDLGAGATVDATNVQALYPVDMSTGSGAAVTATIGGGAVTTLTLTAGGSGYVPGTFPLGYEAVSGVSGFRAVYTANASGVVTSVQLLSGGSGFATVPTIWFPNGGGFGFYIGSADSQFTNCRAVGCSAINSSSGPAAGRGFDIDAGALDVRLVNCASVQTSCQGYYIKAASNLKLIGCEAKNASWGNSDAYDAFLCDNSSGAQTDIQLIGCGTVGTYHRCGYNEVGANGTATQIIGGTWTGLNAGIAPGTATGAIALGNGSIHTSSAGSLTISATGEEIDLGTEYAKVMVIKDGGASTNTYIIAQGGASGAAAEVLAYSDSVANVGLTLGAKGTGTVTLAGNATVGDGSHALGFYGATGTTGRPAVTGSKGANAALTSLMSTLAALGLVTDSTT